MEVGNTGAVESIDTETLVPVISFSFTVEVLLDAQGSYIEYTFN